MRPKPRPACASTASGVVPLFLNSHDANAVAGSILPSVYSDVLKPDLIYTDDLIDDISAGETLPRAGPVGAPTASPVAQFNRKHKVVAAMTVHITSRSLKVQSYNRRRRRNADQISRSATLTPSAPRSMGRCRKGMVGNTRPEPY